MAAVERQLPHRAPRRFQLLGDRLAGRERDHPILFAMGEQDRWLRSARLPQRVGIAAAADQRRQRQSLLPGDVAAAHIERHRRALGETQQGRGLQRHRGPQGQETAPQPAARLGQIRPGRMLQVVPLAARTGGMGPGCAQGDHAHIPIDQLQSQLQQVIGIRTPAVQQHQPA